MQGIKVRKTGSTHRPVTCERCGTQFVYKAERTVERFTPVPALMDEGEIRRKGEQLAKKQLEQELANASDVIPCPSCGWVQQEMIDAARRDRFRLMREFGWPLVAAAVILALLALGLTYWNQPVMVNNALLVWCLVAGVGLAGVGLLLGRRLLSSGFDPNREDVETRKRRGQECSVSRAEFDKQQQQQQADAAHRRQENPFDFN